MGKLEEREISMQLPPMLQYLYDRDVEQREWEDLRGGGGVRNFPVGQVRERQLLAQHRQAQQLRLDMR